MREQETEFRKKNANIAAIGLGDFSYARMFREDSKIDFPLLIDEERRAYRAAGLRQANILHLLKSENFAARSRAHAAGHRQHKIGKNPFQLGGSFVFGPGNVDLFAHLSRTFGDNTSTHNLLNAIS